MRFIKIALCALVVISVQAASARDAYPVQGHGDAALSSLIAQRTFAGLLPSIADYSQTAHSVLKDGEYCPADSLTGASNCQPGAKWVMWDTPFMQFDKKDGQGDYAGWKMDMSGFGTGLGRMLSDTTVVGLAIGWDARKADLDRFWDLSSTQDIFIKAKDRSDAVHAAIYGGTAIGCFFLDAYAGFSKTWHRVQSINTNITASTVSVFKAKYDDSVYSVGVKASYVWILPNEMRITSSLGLDFSHIGGDKFKLKRDGVFSGHLERASFNSLQMPVNVSINRTFQSGALAFKGKPSWWTPEVRAGYVPQFGRDRTSIDVGGGKFKSSEYVSYGTIGAGVKIKLADKFIFAVDYDYRFGRDYRSHLVTGTYGVSF